MEEIRLQAEAAVRELLEIAGLQAGDVITAVDEQSVASASDLCQAEAGCRPGDTMELTVFRKGEYLTLEAVLEAPTEGDDFFHTVTGK